METELEAKIREVEYALADWYQSEKLDQEDEGEFRMPVRLSYVGASICSGGIRLTFSAFAKRRVLRSIKTMSKHEYKHFAYEETDPFYKNIILSPEEMRSDTEEICTMLKERATVLLTREVQQFVNDEKSAQKEKDELKNKLNKLFLGHP